MKMTSEERKKHLLNRLKYANLSEDEGFLTLREYERAEKND
jgi:hypothetical protein